MTNEEYEKFVRESASPKYDETLAVCGLCGEVGELADVVKKSIIYPERKLDIRDKVVDEAGDVLWQLTLLLTKYNITLDQIKTYNYHKLTERHNGVRTDEYGGKR